MKTVPGLTSRLSSVIPSASAGRVPRCSTRSFASFSASTRAATENVPGCLEVMKETNERTGGADRPGGRVGAAICPTGETHAKASAVERVDSVAKGEAMYVGNGARWLNGPRRRSVLRERGDVRHTAGAHDLAHVPAQRIDALRVAPDGPGDGVARQHDLRAGRAVAGNGGSVRPKGKRCTGARGKLVPIERRVPRGECGPEPG